MVVNLIDKPTIEQDIFNARSKGADVIIACMHWGDEYVRIPPQRVQELSAWLIEQGVDHIIGNHPHIIQPIEIRENPDTPDRHTVVYSTGNLVSNMSMRGTDGGMMIRMQLKKILNYTRVSSLEYLLTWIAPKRNDGSRDFTILPASTTLCPANSNAQKKLQQFLDDTRELFNKHNKGDIKEFYTDSVSVTP
jgi:poly-gamma-glutamate synthesis protein (capsule biosynthesis protein)